MKLPRIEIPTLQNWSCHGCSDCCRGQLLIAVSPEEKLRIEKQNWTAADGVDPSAMIVAAGNAFRLGHQADGACVFLDAAGRCRIHAKFGEEAKPLACRLYPLVIHPAGKKLVVGLRFSCPSAVANRGQPMPELAPEIQKLARLVVPGDYEEGVPPPILDAPGGEWPDFLRFVKWLDISLAAPEIPVALKLVRTLHWLAAVEKGRLDQITGAGADEILEVLIQSALKKVSDLQNSCEKPSRFGQLFLRTMVFEYARTTNVEGGGVSGESRWKRLLGMFSFLGAGGRTPALRQGLASVEFGDIEQSFSPLTSQMEVMLTRYFRVKIQSLHFCGAAFHDRPLMEGFRSLALLYPVIIWLSRWLAVSDGRTKLSDADVARAISMVDYHHSYSPHNAGRVRLLHQRNDISKLCGWYGG